MSCDVYEIYHRSDRHYENTNIWGIDRNQIPDTLRKNEFWKYYAKLLDNWLSAKKLESFKS